MRTMVSAINEKLGLIVKKTDKSDGLILAIGIGALVTGVLVDVFIVRVLCLLLVLGSAALTVVLIRFKRLDLHGGLEGANSHRHQQVEKREMKKLIFDDFQSSQGEQFRIEEVQEEHAVSQTLMPAAVSATQSFTHHHNTFSGIKQEAPPAVREFQISDFFDIDSDIYRGDPEPRTEFNFLLQKVLTVIKEVLFAHSVAFFWANREKHQMVLEARISDSANFIPSRRFAMGHDLVSKVAGHGKPELVSEVNPLSERELLPYYVSISDIKSYAGVPVYFSQPKNEHALDLPVAVIAVDSKVEDAFGQETLSLLGQCTKLASALIKSYTDKYDLLLDSELLRSIRRLQERIRNNFTLATIIQSLSEETSKLVSWDHLSIVLYDERRHCWVARKVTNRATEGYITSEQAIDFPESIVGQAIKHNNHGVVDDLETSILPRYIAGEKVEKKGSFISVPISSLNKCYGALNVESREKYNFSRQDIEMLYRLAENAASALELLYMQEVINEYVIVDDVTGLYSKKFFTQRMEEELHRADDEGTDASLLFLTVDKANDIAARYGKIGFERVIVTLAKAIRASVRPYDIVGRYDTDRFGILLLNTAANEAYLWAEKIRKNVSSHVISLDGKTFSVTISIGVCGALEGMRKEDLLGNSIAVLNRATESGGNAVRVF